MVIDVIQKKNRIDTEKIDEEKKKKRSSKKVPVNSEKK